MVWVEILGICVASSTFIVLLSGFWVSGLQYPSLRDPFPVPVPWSPVPGSQSPRVPGPRIPGVRVTGSRVAGSWGPGSQVSGSQVLILDYAQIEIVFIKISFKDSKKAEGIRNYVSE